jgi:AraC-like DNA-binding protein
MEAATPLPFARVHVSHGRLAIDALVVDDETAVRLAAERDDPARFVVEAIEIGARVLDREQTGANAEFVRAEFEKTARELDSAFVERARAVAERLDRKVDEVFGPEHGHVTRALARHFGDESSVAVQHRVKAVLGEVSAQMREDLRRQFSADADSNPLAVFQRTHLAAARQIAGEQSEHLRAMSARLEAMRLEIAELRAEKEKLAELAAVEDKGTAKGRTYEEAVAEAIDAIAAARGDGCDAVGDVRGEGGKKGDVVVAIEACAGPARGKVVFEAKNKKLSRNEALAELDGALETRGADYAVLVVPGEAKLPARTHPLREFNGDKLFVTFDPEDGSTLALEVAYGLARARVLMARAAGGGIDAAALGAELERAP